MSILGGEYFGTTSVLPSPELRPRRLDIDVGDMIGTFNVLLKIEILNLENRQLETCVGCVHFLGNFTRVRAMETFKLETYGN